MADGKILIFGKGFIGQRMLDHFGNRAVLSSADITDQVAVGSVLDSERPAIVINAAAKTATAQLELPEQRSQAYAVNVQAPAMMALACRERGVRMVHISSAMMFDGDNITEDDVPTPQGFYAWTKAWADAQLVPLMKDGVLVVRIHTPVSSFAHPKNLLTKLQGFSQVVNAPASLTVIEDFLTALEALLDQGADGIYNMTNPGSISMYRIVELLKEGGLVPSDKEVSAISREELADKVKASGGSYQPFPVLSTRKLEGRGIAMRPVEEAVRASINEYRS